MIFELGVELRNDGVILAGNRHDSEFQAFLGCDGTEFRHVHADERRVLFQFEDCHLKLSSCEFKGVGCCGSFQEVHNLSCCNLFRIEKKVNAHFSEEVLVLICEILFCVDPGCHFLAAKLLCQHRTDDVDIL